MLNLEQCELHSYKSYVIVKTEDGASWLIREGKPIDITWRKPFLRDPSKDIDRSGLFLRFAELKESKSAVLAFANEFGNLSRRQGFVSQLYGDGRGAETDPSIVKIPEVLQRHAVAEPLDVDGLRGWYWMIREFRFLVALWRKVAEAESTGSVDGLESYVRLQTDEDGDPEVVTDHRLGVSDRFDWHRTGQTGAYAGPVKKGEPREAVILRAASSHLQMVVDRHLAKSSIEIGFAFNSASRRPALRVRPLSLRAGLWLQFAEAVAGNVMYVQCVECGKWFALSHSGDATKRRTRSTKKYCSTRCRGILYRDKRRARTMESEGKSQEEIAEILNRRRTDIKRWILEGAKDA